MEENKETFAAAESTDVVHSSEPKEGSTEDVFKTYINKTPLTALNKSKIINLWDENTTTTDVLSESLQPEASRTPTGERLKSLEMAKASGIGAPIGEPFTKLKSLDEIRNEMAKGVYDGIMPVKPTVIRFERYFDASSSPTVAKGKEVEEKAKKHRNLSDGAGGRNRKRLKSELEAEIDELTTPVNLDKFGKEKSEDQDEDPKKDLKEDTGDISVEKDTPKVTFPLPSELRLANTRYNRLVDWSYNLGDAAVAGYGYSSDDSTESFSAAPSFSPKHLLPSLPYNIPPYDFRTFYSGDRKYCPSPTASSNKDKYFQPKSVSPKYETRDVFTQTDAVIILTEKEIKQRMMLTGLTAVFPLACAILFAWYNNRSK